ncbi:MAG: hypothetical protein ACRDE5_14725, partial [Ginsengibacter sp.]
MKKITLHSIQSVFLFLFCSITATKVYSQQKINAEQFNFTQLSNRPVPQIFQNQADHELDGGWRYLKGNMPIPSHGKIMKQNVSAVPSPSTIETSSPVPVQS